ncbi:helix-turn-helix transcriptional regulator [Streptococcus agalactiae]|uniref:helix-turn-helix domain-containing protein n=1 Tax=Streptococcus agalactiae TaxID=1311 RepID=UPI001374B7A3|nr:helix-turn-helix transcriptional regulator [Streptococcus agalactiae]MCD0020566.1 helix-turn-helix transcriptional regulator [Streptococcus agalactiae]HEN9895400.1 helix-turn-helix transcriptional regulator [Streptococcus agalactiae]
MAKNIRLKELRESKNKSLGKLSALLKEKYDLNVSPSQLMYYEKGTRSPRDPIIWEKLANYFDVPISYLLGYEDITIGDALDIYTQIEKGNINPEEAFARKIKEEIDFPNKFGKEIYEQIRERVKDVDIIKKQNEISTLLKLAHDSQLELVQHLHFKDDELTEAELDAIKQLLKDLYNYGQDFVYVTNLLSGDVKKSTD